MGELTKEQLKEQRFKGYSAGDVVGQGGLEWSFDRWLRGRDGVAKVEVDALGRPKQHDPVPGGRLPEPGDTLVTTLDANVQAKTEEALRYAIDLAHSDGRYKAAGGAAFASSHSLMTAVSSTPQSMITSDVEIHNRKKMIEVRVPWRSLFRTMPMAEKWTT
jgi:cell division protein FtsI/penicillin-binding protein 2